MKMNKNMLSGEIKSDEAVGVIFSRLQERLMDEKELVIDMSEVSFISVSFLDRLEKLLLQANELSTDVRITNVQPTVYKVFRVARIKSILQACS